MHQKRNIRLLISLGVLMIATIAAFVLINSSDQEVVDKNIFRVGDLKQIDKIVLKNNEQVIELKFDGARWKVNNQLADRSMIDVLFATLQQAEPKRAITESLQDSISARLKNDGVKVSLYSGDDLQKEFLAGGNANKTQAYFKNPVDEKCYLMVIPGYHVYTSGIFELEENGWKDKYVFNFNWKNFQTLKSVVPDFPQHDFEIGMGKTYYEVKGITAVDTTKLNDYLDAISLLTVDQFIKKEEVADYDSLLKGKPFLELQVSDVSGKNYTLSLYDSGNKTFVLGMVQGSQPAIFDKRKVAGILKRKDWFVKK